MARRRTDSELAEDAVAGLLVALHDVGIDALVEEGERNEPGAMLTGTFDGRDLALLVVQTAYCTAARAQQLIEQFGEHGGRVGAVPIVVADRVTADARVRLQSAGWSWLDLTAAQLHLRAPGVRIIQSIAPSPARSTRGPRRATISSGAGVTVAYWLCSHPGRSLRPTLDAPELGIAPSTVSTAVGQLEAAGLVDDDGTGRFPELFWELAERWQPQRQWLAAVPSTDGVGDRYEVRHWRRTGTDAALHWGAPLAAGSDQAIELYLPGPAELNTTARRYGVVPAGTGPAAISVAPTSLIFRGPNHTRRLGGWEVAPLIAVALDLAIDPGRGREVLQDWAHPDAVWR